MEKTGKVWLVGAGPGDSGLLTKKAEEVINQADVIIYDALISLEILSSISSDAEFIYAGKRASHHVMPQEEINQIILDKVTEGKKVVRLKGGDPFLFGRGGEELELLAQQGIPFEIVPGITSAIAVPAYAGIPVTHRDMVSSLHIITGHARKGGDSRIHYDALAKLNGTLVFLMGVTAMEEICENLIKAGMDELTPAAILENGTNAKQRRVVANLKTLPSEAKKVNIHTPAIIIVGEVCSLEEKFYWAEKQALWTKQILVTRPAGKASVIAKKLRTHGAHIIFLPAIETRAYKETKAFEAALEEIKTTKNPKWLVFTSPSGVDAFFGLLRKNSIDLRSLFQAEGCLRFAVIGSATKQALEEHGIYADLMPEQFYGKNLGEMLVNQIEQEHNKEEAKVYLFRAKKAGKDLPEILQKAGILTEEISTYETVFLNASPWKQKVETALRQKEIDYVTFTSVSTVESFIECMGEIDYSTVCALCIGEKTAEEARKYRMQVVTSEKATIDSMVEKILERI